MLYRTMPGSNDKISILGFGRMRLPGSMTNPDEAKSIELIRSSIEKGINYFDTAWPYHAGKSEVILGNALKDGYREKVKIADKLPFWLCKTKEDMDYYLNTQLERLSVGVIDYYMIHALDGAMWKKMKALGVIDFLEKAKKDGKILYSGFSFHGSREDFKTIIDENKWDFCQIQFNILDEHDQAGIEGLEYAASRNIGVIIMEPLRGGTLAGKLPVEVQRIYDRSPNKRTNAGWALRWIWNHPGVITVLSGMNDQKQIDENIQTASDAQKNSLTPEELKMIKDAADAFRKIMKVKCTGCQYCMPCPQNINIPLTFSSYNNKYLFNKGFYSRMIYLFQSGGIQGKKPALASQCINCGLCAKRCPQNINIPLELKNVKKEFEGIFSKPLIFMLDKMISAGGKKEKK